MNKSVSLCPCNSLDISVYGWNNCVNQLASVVPVDLFLNCGESQTTRFPIRLYAKLIISILNTQPWGNLLIWLLARNQLGVFPVILKDNCINAMAFFQYHRLPLLDLVVATSLQITCFTSITTWSVSVPLFHDSHPVNTNTEYSSVRVYDDLFCNAVAWWLSSSLALRVLILSGCWCFTDTINYPHHDPSCSHKPKT